MTIGINGKSRGDSHEIRILPVYEEEEEKRELTFFALFGFRVKVDDDSLSFEEVINEAPLDFAAIEREVHEAMLENDLALSAEFGEQIPFIIATEKDGEQKNFGPDGLLLPYSGEMADVAIEAMRRIGHLLSVDSDTEFTEQLKRLHAFYREHLPEQFVSID